MEEIKISFAPMEGIAIYCYRNAHHKYFSEGIDNYYTPFLAVHKHHAFKKRDMREIVPENNEGMMNMIIPQIMAGSSDEILWAIEDLAEKGFKEINLNVGCPVSTVVTKSRGSGLLKDPDHLDRILYEVYSSETVKAVNFTIKTRIGMENPEEFYEILPIYNKYPLSKLIIHPRVRTQMYKGVPDMDIFKWAYENSKNPLCYNGNINSVSDYRKILENFPDIKEIMIGRGLIANPALAREIKTGKKLTKEELMNFMDEMMQFYKVEIPGEIQIMHKLKELWFYVGDNFVDKNGKSAEAYIHKIRVARDIVDYRNAVRALYRECDMK